jgi:hypothetical protein
VEAEAEGARCLGSDRPLTWPCLGYKCQMSQASLVWEGRREQVAVY